MTKRYKLIVEYDGSNYCGFQKQKNLSIKSIEGILEDAIFELSKERVKITPCGRTDAGVHALGQVVHFDLKKNFKSDKIVSGINFYIKNEDVAVLSCEIVDEKFHARLSTKMRYYQYVIINRGAKLVLDKKRAYHVVQNLNIDLMQEAANYLIGKHDFSSFRDAECQAQSPIRSINSIKIIREGERIFVNVAAKSFLHHMVRNIVGTLVWAGKEKVTPKKIKNILEAKDRTKSGPNAPSHGLYFLKSQY